MTLFGIKRKIVFYLINHIYAGTRNFRIKRKLLNSIGFDVNEGTKIVGPIFCSASLTIGKNCWIGKNLIVNGNGNVVIGDNCDVAPEVTLQTGGHQIGTAERRAGDGIRYNINIGDGCWIGARSTILGGVSIANGCVVAACACVSKDVAENTLVGGVPAREIKRIDD